MVRLLNVKLNATSLPMVATCLISGLSLLLSACSPSAYHVGDEEGSSTLQEILMISDPTPPVGNESAQFAFTVTYLGQITVTQDMLVAFGLGGTATDSCSYTIAQGGPDTAVVTVTGCKGNGTVGLWVTTTDADGLASSVESTGKAQVDNTPPSISGLSLVGAASGSSATQFEFTATYNEDIVATVDPTLITLTPTGTVSCANKSVGQSSANSTYIRVSDCTGNGTFSISSVGAGLAKDLAGNSAAAYTTSSVGVGVTNLIIPSLSISAPAPAAVNSSGSVAYTIAYVDADAITLNASDIVVAATGSASCAVPVVSGTGTNTRTVTFNTCTGDGTIKISILAGSAANLNGQLAPAKGPSTAFDVDHTPPTVNVPAPSVSPGPGIGSTSTVSFPITYTGAASFSLAGKASVETLTGNATCSGVAVAGPTTATPTVTLTGCTGDGTLRLVIAASAAQDVAGNTSILTNGSALTIDNTAPTLNIPTAVVSPSPVGSPTPIVNSSSVITYAVTYTGATAFVLPGKVSVSTLSGNATCSGISVINGTTGNPTVAVSNCTGDGSIQVAFAGGAAQDSAGNVTSSGTGEVFLVDNAGPTVNIPSPTASPSPGVNSSTTLSFDVTYAGGATYALSGKVSVQNLSGNAACSGINISNPTTSTPTVHVSNCTGDGTVRLVVAAGAALDDLGNPNAITNGLAITIDNTSPTVTIPSPTYSPGPGPIFNQDASTKYALIYSGATTYDLTNAHISIETITGNATCPAISIELADPSAPVVELMGCTGNGTFRMVIASGAIHDAAGNTNPITNGPIETVDNTAPTISVSSPSVSVANSSSTIEYTVTYSGETAIYLDDTQISFNSNGPTCDTPVVTTTGTHTRKVALSNCTGDGLLGIDVSYGTATDGNENYASSYSATQFTVDNTPPTISISAPNPTAIVPGDSVDYTVSFSGATSATLVAGDITLHQTGATCTSVGVVGSGTGNRTVTISGCTGAGSVAISLAPHATDAVGNAAVSPGTSAAFTLGGILVFAPFQRSNTVIGQIDTRSNLPAAATETGLSQGGGSQAIAGGRLYIPDAGNNRVLGYNTVPTDTHPTPDFVLGQADFVHGGSSLGFGGMSNPAAVYTDGTHLVVADIFNNRILIWNALPTTSGTPADVVVGQPDENTSQGSCDEHHMLAPYRAIIVGTKLIVSETGNNRVLIWDQIPVLPDTVPDHVLGQPDFTNCNPATARDRFSMPTGLWSDGTRLFVSDTANNRILAWNSLPSSQADLPDFVLGQTDFTSSSYGTARDKFGTFAPGMIEARNGQFFAADVPNNRVLIYNTIPADGTALPDQVLGQSDFVHGAYNDDDQDGTTDYAPSDRTMAFPLGLTPISDGLIVGELGNHRVSIYKTGKRLSFLNQPVSVLKNQELTPAGGLKVAVQNSANVTDTTDNTTVITLSVSHRPNGGNLVATGSLSQTVVNGVATFTGLSFDTPSQELTLIAKTNTGATSATTNNFKVDPGLLVFLSQPSDVILGQAMPAFQVALLDSNFNIATNDNTTQIVLDHTHNSYINDFTFSGNLTGTTTRTVVNGVATFNDISVDTITLDPILIGAYAVGDPNKATNPVPGPTDVPNPVTPNNYPTLSFSNAFIVVGGVLNFTVQPHSNGLYQNVGPVKVAVQDFNSNTVTSDNSTVVTLNLNSSPGATYYTENQTVVNGVATFSNITFDAIGPYYTLIASATDMPAVQSTFFEVYGTHLVFSSQPTTTARDQAIPDILVSIEDSSNTLISTDNSTMVTLAIDTNPSSGVLSPSNLLTTQVVNGVATFSGISIDQPGTNYKLSATAAGAGSVISSAFNITGDHLAFDSQPSTTTLPGALPSFAVSVRNTSNQVVSTNTAVVTLAIRTNPNNEGTLSSTTSLSVTTTNGVATFTGVSIDKAATGYTLIATSPDASSATSNPFNIVGNFLDFTAQPSTVAQNQAMANIQVTVKSPGGATVTTDNSTVVTLAINTNPSAATLSSTASLSQTVSNGVATFTGVSLNNYGRNYNLKATAPSATTAISNFFNIDQAYLAFVDAPYSTVANVTMPPVQVAIKGTGGQTITSDNSTAVTIEIHNNPNAGTLAGTLVATMNNGIATFSDLSIDQVAEGYSFRAYVAGGGAVPAADMSDEFSIDEHRSWTGTPTNDLGSGFGYTDNGRNYLVQTPPLAINTNRITLYVPPWTQAHYTIDPDIAALTGLRFNDRTGTLSGYPTIKSALQTYTITATQQNGDFYTALLTIGTGTYGDGNDGYLSVSPSNSTQVNYYTHITDASIPVRSRSFTVDDPTGFFIGKQVFIAQMQDSSLSNFHQEFATVKNVSGNLITLSGPLQYAYTSGSPNTISPAVTQVITVLQPDSVYVFGGGLIYAKPWDGRSGGLIVMRTLNNAIVEGRIDASSSGYRGGQGTGDAFLDTNFQEIYPNQGESWNGYPAAPNSPLDFLLSTLTRTLTNGAGGHGYTTVGNYETLVNTRCTGRGSADGGFGSYGTVGMDGEVQRSSGLSSPSANIGGAAGTTYGDASLSQLFLGSGGGGASGDNCNLCYQYLGAAGAGGGAIMLITGGDLKVHATTGGIFANGSDSIQNCGSLGELGGGSGGSIYLTTKGLTQINTNRVRAKGGSYLGSSGVPIGGGDGRIRIEYRGTAPGTPVPTAGSSTNTAPSL